MQAVALPDQQRADPGVVTARPANRESQLIHRVVFAVVLAEIDGLGRGKIGVDAQGVGPFGRAARRVSSLLLLPDDEPSQ